MVMVGKLVAGEDLNWSQLGVFLWKMIPNVNSMLHCKGPQMKIGLLWPHDCVVQQHRSCPSCGRLHSILSHPILVVSTNPREVNRLTTQLNVSPELSGTKRCVVCLKVFQLDTKLIGKLLKEVLAFKVSPTCKLT